MRCIPIAAILLMAALPAQNSTRKIRPEPGATAARAGGAVPWRADLETALAEARRTGRPVFWYVPTVAGSAMDRRVEIDRYMRAGPFSWPAIIGLLQRELVPVKQVAAGDLQECYRLERGAFIEPGFLVLDGDGTERARLDRLTTFHPQWFGTVLAEAAGVEAPVAPRDGLAPAREHVAAGRWEKALVLLDERGDDGARLRAETSWLRGACLWRLGRSGEARAVWRRLGNELPDHPLAWKAAMEAEGHGPFARGFEVYASLPDEALARVRAGSRAPAGSYGVADLWRRGVAFLTGMQRENGGFEDSRYDFGGTDSLPNVHVAVTSVVGCALLAAEGAGHPVGERLDVLYRYVTDPRRLATADRDEILWAHTYRTRFLCRWLDRRGDEGDARAQLERAVGEIVALQRQDGAWFHEYANPFAIASALAALHDAAEHGAEVDGAAVERGVLALLRCRTEDGAYSYGYPRRRPVRADPVAAAGRMPLCELALFRWRDDDATGSRGLGQAIATAFRHHDRLAAVRKYDDHADAHGYGGFFFWFDMQGRTEAILALPPGRQRRRLVERQRELILDLPEIDGCFIDSHELGRCYGTGMALWCLDLLGAVEGEPARSR